MLLPRAMKAGPGNYVEAPEIHEQHASFIRVHLDRSTPAHVDGEIFSQTVRDLEYSIQPGRLNLIMPVGEKDKKEKMEIR